MSAISTTQLKQRTFNEETVLELSHQGYSPLYAQLVAQRGINHQQPRQHQLADLYHWSKLKGIEKASQQLALAISHHKRIVIIADYDADGATACAVALRALRAFGAEVDYVVPNRLTMGYGLTPEVVDLAREKNADILLTVDNGIASIEGVNYAHQHGLSVIITDHHLPGDILPEAEAIVNPNQPDCHFPSKALAGVGVVFYVMLALRHRLREEHYFKETNAPNLAQLLDLVALGTVADLVPLDGNNRLLVREGLKRVRQGQCQPGMRALFEVSGRDMRRAQCSDLGFAIGPRINAAGRMDDMTIGIECLTSDSFHQAMTLAEQLHQFNQDRKQVEETMQGDALEQLNELAEDKHYTITLYNSDWHPGVVGLVASRLKERYHRPVFAFADDTDENTIRGSGRSISGFHLRDSLDLISKRDPSIITRFGGHAAAAGVTIRKDKLPIFTQLFEEVAQKTLDEEALTQRIYYDVSLKASDITIELAQLCAEEVWGQGFPAPLFLGQFSLLEQRIVGEKHSRLTLNMENSRFQGIYFNYHDTLPRELTLLFRVSLNEWMGRSQLQLEIVHWCHV